MGIIPKNIDITKSFTISGVKYIGEYIYVLLIDGGSSLSIIKRVKTDDSEIKFHCIDDAENINAFWADPEAHSATGDIGYTWIDVCTR